MSDPIDRQAAIDALWKALYEYEDKTEKQFIESDDLDIEEWILHRVFVQNMSDIDRKVILHLPSAQPEVLACGSGELVQESDSLVKDLVKDCISRQAAIKAVLGLENCYNGFSDTYDKSCIVGLLEELPKVDAEPVRHGRWLDGNRGKHDGTLYWYRYCSACLYERHDDNEDKDTPYCPNCGAKMRTENEDE